MAGELKPRTAFWPVLFIAILSAIAFAIGVQIASSDEAEGSSKYLVSECDNGNRVYYFRYADGIHVVPQDPTCSASPTPTQSPVVKPTVPAQTTQAPEVPSNPTPRPTAANTSSQP